MSTLTQQPVHPLLGSVAAALPAILLWSLAPLLVEAAGDMAPLRLSALALLAGALATAALGPRRSRLAVALSPAWRLALFVLVPLLMVGAVGAYLAGLGMAPTAEAALITYTWPVLFVVISQWLGQGRVTLSALGGAAVAFAGGALLLAPQALAGGMSGQLAGYGLALLAGCCWALYSWLCQAAPVALTALMPRLFLVAGGMAGLLSLAVEGMAGLPAGQALLAGVALGVGPYGVAMVCWDRALRLGHAGLVGSLAYGVPVFAALFMVMAGVATPDWRLPAAAALVVAGCAVSGRAPRGRQKRPGPTPEGAGPVEAVPEAGINPSSARRPPGTR